MTDNLCESHRGVPGDVGRPLTATLHAVIVRYRIGQMVYLMRERIHELTPGSGRPDYYKGTAQSRISESKTTIIVTALHNLVSTEHKRKALGAPCW